jgi:hypothetical protein
VLGVLLHQGGLHGFAATQDDLQVVSKGLHEFLALGGAQVVGLVQGDLNGKGRVSSAVVVMVGSSGALRLFIYTVSSLVPRERFTWRACGAWPYHLAMCSNFLGVTDPQRLLQYFNASTEGDPGPPTIPIRGSSHRC